MGKWISLLFILLLVFAYSINAADWRVGMDVGHYGGLAWDAYGSIHHFAQGLPLAARINLGYVTLDPGNAADARRIFINNNQGGTVQEKGTIIRFSFDFMYPVRFLSIPESFIYFGPRYASFKGNFKFIGNNEDFDVTSKHWGFGAGLESGFPISKKLGFTINAGFDYYKPATLYGHDTSYAPDGESVNPREDYQYSDANEAINQPGLELRLMLGFNYRFGK